jgi:hypothetical protein
MEAWCSPRRERCSPRSASRRLRPTTAGRSPTGSRSRRWRPRSSGGYLVYLTVYRKCQYFGFKEECQFCDINENFRQQKRAGRPYNTVKEVDEILEALAIIDEEDVERRSRAYTITGGSIVEHLRGHDEAGFYARYAKAIEDRFPGRWISKMVVQALPRESLLAFRDAGVRIYHPNYEVWDRRLFSIICPGKERYIGRDEWMRRIVDAADVFGPSRVIPNFVAGVEMALPHGFATVKEALDSTGGRARVLHVEGHHAPIHDVVSGAAQRARAEPGPGSPRIPRGAPPALARYPGPPPAARAPGLRPPGRRKGRVLGQRVPRRDPGDHPVAAL